MLAQFRLVFHFIDNAFLTIVLLLNDKLVAFKLILSLRTLSHFYRAYAYMDYLKKQ